MSEQQKKAIQLYNEVKIAIEKLRDAERLMPIAKCPQCGTFNYHFKDGNYCCAFC